MHRIVEIRGFVRCSNGCGRLVLRVSLVHFEIADFLQVYGDSESGVRVFWSPTWALLWNRSYLGGMFVWGLFRCRVGSGPIFG